MNQSLKCKDHIFNTEKKERLFERLNVNTKLEDIYENDVVNSDVDT